MGCCTGNGENSKAETLRSKAIDRQLEEDSKKLRRECKILMLGTENSGKSTIVKQMKIIHQLGFSDDERMLYRPTIYKNLVKSIKALIEAMTLLEVSVDNKENEAHCEYVTKYRLEPHSVEQLEPLFGQVVIAIWNDPCIAKVFDRSSEFYLMTSAPYFFDEAARITAPDYHPTEADILRARTRTTGIYETRFMVGQLSIHMFDVGGQRSERKKWVHCFENVTSILYCIALDEYDQVLLEENSQNRMMEALVLFDSVVNSRWFTRTSIIVFLNKVDLFRHKLSRSPLENYFPDYTGGDDVNRAAKYILWRFNQVNRAHLNLYPQQVLTFQRCCHL